MSQTEKRSSLASLAGALGWPLILGSAACSLFYVLIFQGPLHTPWMLRYFASHPIAFAATGMFCVGLASLLLKFVGVIGQFRVLGMTFLPEAPEDGQAVSESSDLLDQMQADVPPRALQSELGKRLTDALEHVERTGSADGLGDELKYLADGAATRQYDSYALARIIIWATPMLGFLGTVVGITQALGDLDSTAMAESIDSAMNQLLSGLYVAFDTTALALALSIILMFVQFLVDRLETSLTWQVDQRVDAELLGRFEQQGTRDPNVAMIRGMTQEVVRSSEQLAQRQAEIWQATIDAAHQQWSQLVHTAGSQIENSLSDAIADSAHRLSTVLTETGAETARQTDRQWALWQSALRENAELLRAQQTELTRQGEVMAQAMQATSDVIKLEQALNQNLKTLAGAKNFEDTVMSLAAAIHLLNTRLGAHDPASAVSLQASASSKGEQAA